MLPASAGGAGRLTSGGRGLSRERAALLSLRLCGLKGGGPGQGTFRTPDRLGLGDLLAPWSFGFSPARGEEALRETPVRSV